MEIEITKQVNNDLLQRIEYSFIVYHPNEATPKRGDIRDKIADQIGSKNKKLVIIHKVRPQFGKQESKGYAKVYKSESSAKSVENKYVLVRNKLVEAGKKKK